MSPTGPNKYLRGITTTKTDQLELDPFKASSVQMGNFFMSGKVLKTVYFLKGNNADNSNLILMGLEEQRRITLGA